MEKKYGVYICKGCGIAEAVEIEKLEEVATKEKQIPLCKNHDALCSPEGLQMIKNDIGEGVNSVVVAACSPRAKHKEFTFPGTVVARANLREMVAWIQEPMTEDTTALAQDYMRFGITTAQNSFLPEPFFLDEMEKSVLVVGGGISGMTSALGAADAGYNVVLVEKQEELGGWAKKMYKQLPQSYPFESIEVPTINDTMDRVNSHDKIKVFTSSTIEKIVGVPGMYDVAIKTNAGPEQVKAGSVVLAAGWRPYDANKLDHLGYGKNANVITNVQMEELASSGKITRPSDGREAKRVAFIQCAGSRDTNHLAYCSSYCCLTSLKQAAYVRENNPDAMAYILYKDMRTPGQYELFYKKMQNDPGVMLTKGEVVEVRNAAGDNVEIVLKDTLLGESIVLEADLLVLATGMVPNTRIEPEMLAEFKVKSDEKLKASGGKPDPNAVVEPHKVPNLLNLDYKQGPELPQVAEAYGFADSNYICFQYETQRTGIYAAGSIRQPMHMLGSIEDAMGASMKAIQCLEATEKGFSIHPRAWDQTYPVVNLPKCTSCKRCTEECPFSAIEEDSKGTPFHKMSRCRRCGTCLGACPERVISFKDFSIHMVSSMFKSMDIPEEGLRIVGLVCENDAYPALDAAALNRKKIHPAFRFLPVRCLGNLNLAWIADALSVGIDGVVLLGCKFGENYQCHFVKGSELANERLGKLQETLQRLMLEPERVNLMQLSIQDYDKLPQMLNDFAEELGEMEPNPFKEF